MSKLIIDPSTIAPSHHKMLQAIVQHLKERNIAKEEVTEIGVVMEQGKFSSTRIATTITNAWKFFNPHIQLFSVSTDGVQHPAEGYLKPQYSGEPNIGKKQ